MSVVLKNELEHVGQILNAMRKVKVKSIAMVVIRNQVILTPFIEKLNEEMQLTQTPATMEFMQKEQELTQKYCRKDQNGRLVKLPNGQFDYIDFESFKEEHEKLKASSPDVVAYLEQHRTKVRDILTQEVNIPFEMLNYDELPEALNAEELDALAFIIKDFEKLSNPN